MSDETSETRLQRIEIKIDTTNEVFDHGTEFEVANLLRLLADRLDEGRHPARIRDANGNTCGQVSYEYEAAKDQDYAPFLKIMSHIGHNIAAVRYGGDDTDNAAIECEDCGTVIFDQDGPDA